MAPRSVPAGHDDEPQPRDEEGEHQRQQAVDRPSAAAELLPHEDAPHGRHHRRALSQRIRHRSTGLPGRNVAERCTQTPDRTAQHSDQMGRKAALEVVAVGDGLPVEGAFHHPRIEDEVAQQHADREDKDRRIGRQHAGRRGREVVEVHRRRDAPVEERHQHARHDGQYDAFVRALRKIYKVTLGRKFPMLTNYAVTIPPGGRTDALVQTVITWSYDEQVFRTRGLDADQTEAAIKATMKMLNLIEDEYEKSK